jgi:hypothetical protein
MSDTKRFVRPVLSILIVAATALGLYNVYGDNSAVISQAEKVACGGEKCSFTMTRQERSAFSQGFTFQTTLEQKGGKRTETIDVSCARSAVLVGDYSCMRR